MQTTTLNENKPGYVARMAAEEHVTSGEDDTSGSDVDEVNAVINLLSAEEQMLRANAQELEKDKQQQETDGNEGEVAALDKMENTVLQAAEDHRQAIAQLKLDPKQKHPHRIFNDLHTHAMAALNEGEHETHIAESAHADNVAHKEEIHHRLAEKIAKKPKQKTLKIVVKTASPHPTVSPDMHPPAPVVIASPAHSGWHAVSLHAAAAEHAIAETWHRARHAAHVVLESACRHSAFIATAVHIGGKLLHAGLHPVESASKIAGTLGMIGHSVLSKIAHAGSLLLHLIGHHTEQTLPAPPAEPSHHAFSAAVIDAVKHLHLPFFGTLVPCDPLDFFSSTVPCLPAGIRQFSLAN